MIMSSITRRLYIHNLLIKRSFSENKNNIQVLKTDFPSTKQKRDYTQPKFWTLFRSTSEHINQSSANIFLFPGHGSQFVGMGRSLMKLPQVQKLFESASQYLNYNLLKVCLEGPPEKLNKIIHSHPAIFVISLATLEKIKQEQPELIENCIATAGQSLGEITSLVFAGALSFEAGLHLVRVRAESIQRACLEVNSGSMVVYLNRESRLSEAIMAAKQFCIEKLQMERPVCEISTYLFTECRIIGGHSAALEFIVTFANEFKLARIERLDVAGAFHTPLMAAAYFGCSNALKRIGDIGPLRINALSNTSGTVHTSTSEVRRLLAVQVNRPVLWEQILHRLYMRPPDVGQPTTIEIGPGRSLGEQLGRVNANAMRKYRSID